MIVNCQRDGLLNACQVVAAAIPSRTTMPVYTSIKAIATADCLTLMATDLEVGIRYELRGVHIEEPGEAIWPVSRLIPILRESNDAEIGIETDERQTKVRTKVSNYEMPVEDPAIFTDVDEFSGENYYELAAGDVLRMVRQTVFAAAKEEGKYAMRGVLWDIEDKKAKLVATDGKRLSVSTGPCVVQGTIDTKGQSHLVPPKAMNLLERILGEGDASQPVQVVLHSNKAIFKTERGVINTRLVEGRFPPYREVIPKRFNAKIPLVAGEFHQAIKQAAIMVEDDSKRINMEFKPGTVLMQAQGQKTGKSKVQFSLPDYAGQEINISFDPIYLTEMLRITEPALQIYLDLVDGQRPAVFRINDDFLYLVVPLT